MCVQNSPLPLEISKNRARPETQVRAVVTGYLVKRRKTKGGALDLQPVIVHCVMQRASHR
jgi:hypothetical protein